MIKLQDSTIQDRYIRENFRILEKAVNSETFLTGEFKFFEIDFTAARTNFKFPHNLGFLPKDIIQTSLIGTGTLTWNYTDFDDTFVDITTSGACTVRAFIGRQQ